MHHATTGLATARQQEGLHGKALTWLKLCRLRDRRFVRSIAVAASGYQASGQHGGTPAGPGFRCCLPHVLFHGQASGPSRRKLPIPEFRYFQDLDVEAFMTPRSTQNSRGHLAEISAWRTRIQSSHSEGQAVVQDGQSTPEQTYQSVPRLPTRKRDSAMHQRLRPPVHLCRFTQIESSDDWRVATGFPPATAG